MLTNCLAECVHLTITVSQIERDIGRKSSFFSYTLVFDAPVKGVSVGVSHPVWCGRTRITWLPDGKNFEDIFIRFGATHERDGRTDRHRGGATVFKLGGTK